MAADFYVAATLCFFLKKSRQGLPRYRNFPLYFFLFQRNEFDLLSFFCDCGLSRTDNIIKTLTIYCINTGLLTSFCAIACIIAVRGIPISYFLKRDLFSLVLAQQHAFAPRSFIYIAIYFLLSKCASFFLFLGMFWPTTHLVFPSQVYLNAYLASLNGRRRLVRRNASESSIDTLSNMQLSAFRTRRGGTTTLNTARFSPISFVITPSHF